MALIEEIGPEPGHVPAIPRSRGLTIGCSGCGAWMFSGGTRALRDGPAPLTLASFGGYLRLTVAMDVVTPQSALPWSRELDVVLHGVTRNPAGGVDLIVALGSEPPKTYCASVDVDEPGFHMVSFEEPLFFALSEYAVRRYSNAALYQMELGAIVEAYERDGSVPQLPARLGVTGYWERPSFTRIISGHFRRLLYRLHLLNPGWTHPDYRPGGKFDPRRQAEQDAAGDVRPGIDPE